MEHYDDDEYARDRERISEVFKHSLKIYLRENPVTPEINLEQRVHEFLSENNESFEKLVSEPSLEEQYLHIGDGDSETTISDSIKTQTHLSSSFMSSYVNNVSDIMEQLENSENVDEKVESLKKLTNLAKSDSTIDFFSERVIDKISEYLSDNNETINQQALIFHAGLLLYSNSHLFLYQTFRNLVNHILTIPKEHMTTIGAFRRMRLVLNFLEFNFENVVRIPSWFVQDILEDFMKLVTNFTVFINLILLKYKWFEKLFMKTQFRRHMIDFACFKKFMKIIESILKNDVTVTDKKHKTLIYVNALEIATIACCFDQFDNNELLFKILKKGMENGCNSVKVSCKTSQKTLLQKCIAYQNYENQHKNPN